MLTQWAGRAVSVGFLGAARRRAARLALPSRARVRILPARAGLLRVAETPDRGDGSPAWAHAAGDQSYPARCTGGRTVGGLDAGEVLPDVTGVLVRDGYAGYTHLAAAQHTWCGARYRFVIPDCNCC